MADENEADEIERLRRIVAEATVRVPWWKAAGRRSVHGYRITFIGQHEGSRGHVRCEPQVPGDPGLTIAADGDEMVTVQRRMPDDREAGERG